MWNYIDNKLKEYLKKHKTNDRELEYRINNIFNMGFEFSNLYSYANNNILKQFRMRLRLFKENYTKNDYISYMVNGCQNRVHIRNSEILRIMLLMEYAEIYQKNYDNQLAMFDEIEKYVVKTTNFEIIKLSKSRLKRRFKRHPFVYEHIFLLHFLSMPNNLGVAWDDHIASIIDYNSNQVYKQAVINLRNDDLKVDTKLIENQTKREINYKPTSKNMFSGQIDNEIAFVTNEMKRQIFNYYGVKKVRIAGIFDSRTCEVCKEYLGNIYNIEDITIGKQIGSHYNCRCYLEPWSFNERT